jgi:hypothetical protein
MAGFASLIVQHFVKAVESSSVRLKPFPHLVVDEILPGDIFRSVFDELPSLSDLARAPNAGVFGVAAYDRRATLPVEELSSPGGPSIWDDVGSGLKSNEVEQTLVQVFSPWIDGKIGQSLGGPLRRQVRIHRDLAGFRLNPHTDAPRIFITSFIYVRGGILATLNRGRLQPEELALTLAEAKDLLQGLQQTMVTRQIVEFSEDNIRCPSCRKPRSRKGKHEIVYRTLFGKLKLESPRYYECRLSKRAWKE